MKGKSINQLIRERRLAYQQALILGDTPAAKEAIRNAEAAIVLWHKTHPQKKLKGRSPGQARYIANLKRQGWL
jgi:hypothetical protein